MSAISPAIRRRQSANTDAWCRAHCADHAVSGAYPSLGIPELGPVVPGQVAKCRHGNLWVAAEVPGTETDVAWYRPDPFLEPITCWRARSAWKRHLAAVEAAAATSGRA